MIVNLDTGWCPSIEEYHALAYEGVWSSSMIWGDFMPPYGHPRLAKGKYVDRSIPLDPPNMDMWRGTFVDSMVFDEAKLKTKAGGMGSKEYHYVTLEQQDGRVLAAIPPLGIDRRTLGGKWQWEDFKSKVEGSPIVGLSTVPNPRNPKEASDRVDASEAHRMMRQARAIYEWLIEEGTRPGGVDVARSYLAGQGKSQLSHRFEWNGIKLRWRPDRIVQLEEGKGYAHLSLKVTRHLHPSKIWSHYGSTWRARDAFYELGWSHLVADQLKQPWAHDAFPWDSQSYQYLGEVPLHWVLLAVHHDPVPQCYVYVVSEEQKRLARRECRRGLELLREAVKINKWSLHEERKMLESDDPKPWEMRREI